MEQYDARNHDEQPIPLNQAIDEIVEEALADAAPIDTTKPNIIKPVEIVLGGKTRKLQFPMWALMKFQEVTGISPWDQDKAWGYPPDPQILVTMLWCALLADDETLTREQVMRFPEFQLSNVLHIRGRLNLLWGFSNPDPDPNAPAGVADPNVAVASTG